MLADRSDIWVPPPSGRAVLRCAGMLALMILATLVTYVAGPRAADPARPGACQRAATNTVSFGLTP